MRLATNIGLVHLHRSLQDILTLREQEADLRCHAPRRFVGNTKLPLQLLSGYAVREAA
jgi:hypothetical protein